MGGQVPTQNPRPGYGPWRHRPKSQETGTSPSFFFFFKLLLLLLLSATGGASRCRAAAIAADRGANMGFAAATVLKAHFPLSFLTVSQHSRVFILPLYRASLFLVQALYRASSLPLALCFCFFR